MNQKELGLAIFPGIPRMTRYVEAICSSPALLTDLYQLTMAQGYWRHGWAERQAIFQLFFRRAPFGGQFAIACGLSAISDFLRRWRFTPQDVAYLATLRTADGRPLFSPDFLDYLQTVRFSGEILAVREGTIVFPNEPMVRVRAGLLVAQLLETPLLNLIGFATLVATKAARVARAAGSDPVIEFGLRRAQGFEASLIAARATYIGGCAGTSNMLAGYLWGIPVRGTQAHSWILAFGDELAAFRAFAEMFPSNCILLVDTFDTIEGVKNAIQVAHELKQTGSHLIGIRLDSGDLVQLSQRARKLLDEAGLPEVLILASGDLDEFEITRLKAAGAKINAWGVGTRLTTAFGEPALSVVYKLAAIQEADGTWRDRMKISAEPAKQTLPGLLRVSRLFANGRAVADVLYDERDPPADRQPARWKREVAKDEQKDLLEPLWQGESATRAEEDLKAIRAYVQEQIASFDEEIFSLRKPKAYSVILARGVARRRRQLLGYPKENKV